MQTQTHTSIGKNTSPVSDMLLLRRQHLFPREHWTHMQSKYTHTPTHGYMYVCACVCVVNPGLNSGPWLSGTETEQNKHETNTPQNNMRSLLIWEKCWPEPRERQAFTAWVTLITVACWPQRRRSVWIWVEKKRAIQRHSHSHYVIVPGRLRLWR